MKIRKYFYKTYHEVFYFDRFVFIALALSLPVLLIAFLFENRNVQLIFITISALLFSIPMTYLLFQPSTYRLKTSKLTLDLKTNELKVVKRGSHQAPFARIIFLTDLHLHEFLPQEFIDKLLDRVNSYKPDVLLFGGDYIVDKLTDLRLLEVIAEFKAPIKLAVLGNHDYLISAEDFREDRITPGHYTYADKVEKKLNEVGIKVLRNENYQVSFKNGKIKLNIFGLDDLWAKKNDMARFSPKDNNLIITHNPRTFESISDKKINLVLSGHNHGGGNIKLNNHISLHRTVSVIPTKSFRYFNNGFGCYISGIYKNRNGTKMYSSTGVGLTGLGVRVNCRPEIVSIDLIN